MNSTHPDIHAFADGELSDRDAETVRVHLGSCAECQRELHEVMQLDTAVFEAAKPMAKVLPLRRLLARPVLALVALAAAAAVVFVTTRSAELTLTGPRSLEARVTWSAAGAWRPYDTVRGSGFSSNALSLSQLAKLEAAGDSQALADALLITGEVARARSLLEALSREKPEVLVDLSAAALAAHHPEEALELAQLALDESPKHAAAAWNKALAARDLGFTGVAARTFAEVATMNEPGWSTEAAERSKALRMQLDRRRERFEAARAAAIKMIFEHVPMPRALAVATPSLARMSLAYALRTAATNEEAMAIDPTKVAAPHAKEMRGLFAFYFARIGVAVPNEVEPTADQLGALVARLVSEKALADLLFALPMTRSLDANLELYAQAVAATNDPLFTFALENERAARDPQQRERRLANVANQAVTVAPLRAMQALEQLAGLDLVAHRATDAQNAAQRALALAREQGEFVTETRLLGVLADAARFRGRRGLAQAALDERVERAPDDCVARRASAESSAALQILMLEPERARARLSEAMTDQCRAPLTVFGATVLSDVLRLGAGKPGDTELLASSLASAPGDEALLALHVEGRALLDTKPAEGRAILERAIATAVAAPNDLFAKKVKAYSFGLLKNAAAENRDYERVFALSRQELGGEADLACTLIVDVEDNRVAVAARTAGGFTGAFERVALTKHHRDGLDTDEVAKVVAPVVVSLMSECKAVRVRASYPLNGRTGWLPDSLAWSYASNQPRREPLPGPWLWVHDVEAPAGYTRLGTGPAAVAFERQVSGSAATPENVVEQMRDAALVEIDAHGVIEEGSDTAHLVLASGPTGHVLDAGRIAALSLEKHPIVVLGACRASTIAPTVHETVSLPQAFLEAGASAVVAAPVDLPDAEARAFFSAVLTRVRNGEPVSEAVRSERTQRLLKEGGAWVRQVLVFN